jgi:4-hydroxy-2-oxoheptanedioate aldolase
MDDHIAEPLRRRVLAGESLLGCFLTWPAPGIADLAALAGFDFLVLDTEHGFLNPESVEHMVLAADAAGIPAVVRVPNCQSPADAGRALDGGAAGILFPRADGLPAVRGAIESVKYAPSGRRGLGGVRANRYGDEPLDRFVRRANEETLVAIQIETRGALEELPQIAAEPAVDLLFVGPNDLSQALQIPGKTSDPRFLEAVGRVAAEAGKAGKAAGVMVSRREDLPRLPEQGYRIFATSDRALVLESGRAWRQALGVRRY